MKGYSTIGIFTSVLLVFSIFTLLSVSEVNAEEEISANVVGYENTIIAEFKNESTSKIKTIKIWLSGDGTFKSFKSEPGWGGGKYSDGKMLVFTVTNTLNPGESVKFGLITNEKVDGINWKALDQNENEVGYEITSIQESSEIVSETIGEMKETGGTLYGTKKFIPEKIRVGSDIRLVGTGFGQEKNLQLYLDDSMLKSVKTDEQGNFLTTIVIPDTINVGTSEFIIKDESNNFQSTNISIDEQKIRSLKTSQFEIGNLPGEIRTDETLVISGNARPYSAVIITIEDMDRVLEKTRVVTASSDGKWVFEEFITQTENMGEKFVIFQNNQYKTTKNLIIKTDYLIAGVEISIR